MGQKEVSRGLRILSGAVAGALVGGLVVVVGVVALVETASERDGGGVGILALTLLLYGTLPAAGGGAIVGAWLMARARSDAAIHTPPHWQLRRVIGGALGALVGYCSVGFVGWLWSGWTDDGAGPDLLATLYVMVAMIVLGIVAGVSLASRRRR